MGSAASSLPQDEGHDEHDRGNGQPDDDRRTPRVLGPSPHRDQQGCGHAEQHQPRTEEVDLVGLRRNGSLSCDEVTTSATMPMGTLM